LGTKQMVEHIQQFDLIPLKKSHLF
jgi:hypothetical protein